MVQLAVNAADGVITLPLLTAQEASDVRAVVHAQRPQWCARHDTQPFFTLGTASYLDARDDQFEQYRALAQRSNPLLLSRFGWLLERLRQAFSSHVGCEATYDPRLALPGFHIFLFDPAFRHVGASVHYDLQHELIDWATLGGTPDVAAQLSLTATIALPAAGGGLLMWDLDRRELERMSPEARIEHSRAKRFATRIPYTVGQVTIHSGYKLHQIGPAPELAPGDERITLQAHALPIDDQWLIYW